MWFSFNASFCRAVSAGALVAAEVLESGNQVGCGARKPTGSAVCPSGNHLCDSQTCNKGCGRTVPCLQALPFSGEQAAMENRPTKSLGSASKSEPFGCAYFGVVSEMIARYRQWRIFLDCGDAEIEDLAVREISEVPEISQKMSGCTASQKAVLVRAVLDEIRNLEMKCGSCPGF